MKLDRHFWQGAIAAAAVLVTAFGIWFIYASTPRPSLVATVTVNEYVTPPALIPGRLGTGEPDKVATYLRTTLVNRGDDGAAGVTLHFPENGEWCIRREDGARVCDRLNGLIVIDSLQPTAVALVEFWSDRTYTAADFDAISLRHHHGVGKVQLLMHESPPRGAFAEFMSTGWPTIPILVLFALSTYWRRREQKERMEFDQELVAIEQSMRRFIEEHGG